MALSWEGAPLGFVNSLPGGQKLKVERSEIPHFLGKETVAE